MHLNYLLVSYIQKKDIAIVRNMFFFIVHVVLQNCANVEDNIYFTGEECSTWKYPFKSILSCLHRIFV